jgi:hypothetical protein
MKRLTIGLTLLAFTGLDALAVEALPISIEGREEIRSDGKLQCLIGIQNQNGSDSLDKVKVTLFDRGVSRLSVGPIDLLPGQASVLEQVVDRSVNCSGTEVFYRVVLQQKGVQKEFVLPGGTVSREVSVIGNQVLGGGLALVSAVVGILLSHWMLISRERRKDLIVRRAKYFDEASEAFRDFLSAWGATPVASELAVVFNTLQRRVVLDQEIVDLYLSTHEALAKPNVSMDMRMAAARDFDRQMRSYIQGLDPYISHKTSVWTRFAGNLGIRRRRES